MTDNQHGIVHLLMKPDLYMMKSQSYPGFYVVYQGNQNPVKRVKLCKNLEMLLKVDKKRRYTLNLSSIRRLHGNNYIKQLYLKTKASK